MVDPLDDLINDIVNEPQPERAEVFSCPNPKPEGVKEDDYLKLKKVPARKRNPVCGICRKKLKGGETHWHCLDEDNVSWWWCATCITSLDKPRRKI